MPAQLQHRAACRHCNTASVSRPSALPIGRTALRVAAQVATDNSARVLGPVRHVFNYVSDFQNLSQWYPGVNGARVTRGAGRPLNLRHQYEIEQTISGMKLTTLYEVVDMQQDKKVVYSSGSDLHSSTEQLIFMPDPNDPRFTVVRYMTATELTEWRRALQPIVSGVLRSRPEQALKNLTSLLNSGQSPIRFMQEQAQASSARSGGWSFNNLLNNLRHESSQGHAPSWGNPGSFRSNGARAEPQVDVLGYYAALGLDAKRSRNVTSDDVKSAFRKAAQLMHPDKFSTADEEDRMEAEVAFRKVQRAYEVLRDPEQRKLYDQGKTLEQVEEAMM